MKLLLTKSFEIDVYKLINNEAYKKVVESIVDLMQQAIANFTMLSVSAINLGFPLKLFAFKDKVFINPCITNKSGKIVEREVTSCSLEFTSKNPIRKKKYETIVLSYFTIDGKKVEETLTDIPAFCAQIEIDNLSGLPLIALEITEDTIKNGIQTLKGYVETGFQTVTKAMELGKEIAEKISKPDL